MKVQAFIAPSMASLTRAFLSQFSWAWIESQVSWSEQTCFLYRNWLVVCNKHMWYPERRQQKLDLPNGLLAPRKWMVSVRMMSCWDSRKPFFREHFAHCCCQGLSSPRSVTGQEWPKRRLFLLFWRRCWWLTLKLVVLISSLSSLSETWFVPQGDPSLSTSDHRDYSIFWSGIPITLACPQLPAILDHENHDTQAIPSTFNELWLGGGDNPTYSRPFLSL